MKQLLICLLFLGYLGLSLQSNLTLTEFDGLVNYAELGYAVSKAGDVNGDGFGDILLSSYTAEPASVHVANVIYLLFGSKEGFPNVNLKNLTSTQGIKIMSKFCTNIGPASVSSAGDVNGDGVDDIIIGTFNWSPLVAMGTGIAHVIFGSRNGLSDMNLTNITSAQGFSIYGDGNGGNLGQSVKGAGDINGDGIDDIIIGAPSASGPKTLYTGAAYVIFGNWKNLTDIYIGNMTNSQGFTIIGTDGFGQFGASVSGAGDVNGDGIDDVIIGASHTGANGTAYVIFGSRHGLPDIDIASLSSSQGFEIIGGNAGDALGNSVNKAGDVNGDGIDDILIGAFMANVLGQPYSGAAYVIYGNRRGFPNALNLYDLDITQGFRIFGGISSYFGGSVSNAGDFNRDGIDDVIIGAVAASTGDGVMGAAYVIFGSASGLWEVDTSNLTSAQGIEIPGIYQYEQFGYSVSNGGDVNGDGVDELLIGAYLANRKYLTKNGAAYVVSQNSSISVMPNEIIV